MPESSSGITSKSPVLVIAPHLTFPCWNGADILIERTARHLSNHAAFVDLIGCSTVTRYSAGGQVSQSIQEGKLRPKWLAALRALLFRSHYFREKFNTPAVTRVVQRLLSAENYTAIFVSYLTTVLVLPERRPGTRLYVWTHNDEFKWFNDIRLNAGSRLTRAVARQSCDWLTAQIGRLTTDAILLHVSETDRAAYEALLPGHPAVVTMVGTDLPPNASWREGDSGSPIVLTFLSSLGVQMAADALLYFRHEIMPSLIGKYGRRLQIQVAGSNPTDKVRQLCVQAGWALRQNLSDDEITAVLHETTFTILPFPYANGVKLKLLRSLGSGVPFLATAVCRPADFPVPEGCCFASNTEDWSAAIAHWLDTCDRAAARKEMITLAEYYSWPNVVSRMLCSIPLIDGS